MCEFDILRGILMGEKAGQLKHHLFPAYLLIFIPDIQKILPIANSVDIEWCLSITKVVVDKTVAFRLYFRLLSNSIKFNDFTFIIAFIYTECHFSLIKGRLWRIYGIDILVINVKIVEIKQGRWPFCEFVAVCGVWISQTFLTGCVVWVH